ncbi:cofactor assembly of complex C subunit B [Iningainema tapete]|uniref:Cofactor assembly of complex C subunit B n=1 Tax=Iningainema tapete BLCC-T55 TaxID=2748662 RepID=A0A8J6XCT4_9CYAN|nr:cofactor assembly of complex C subunit B [Iningainema tapete]MBD2770768.1 cofactor assembly of complex C subunit B [Iningainema tapete BLCC-T55]
MDTAILPSTLLLTMLLSVGLFFFIRASTKDRTQQVQLVSSRDEATLMPQLQEYFLSRSYRVAAVDREQNSVIFEGFVRPSWFLAVFLTLLAAIGLICISLVLSLLFPHLGTVLFATVLLSPFSGIFYWQKAGRPEKVKLMVEPTHGEQNKLSKITVVAHRDELLELQTALQLDKSE